MSQLVLHPTVEQVLRRIEKNPPHALLITGPVGMGKEAIAQHLSATILNTTMGKLTNNAAFLDVSPAEDEPFGIDAIRQVQHTMTLRSGSKHVNGGMTRIALLSNAHRMTKEAQNALLKLLEEPPKDGMLILTATSEHALLTTIASRCQIMNITKPDSSALSAFFRESGYDDKDIELALRMSNGLPGLTAAMLDTSQEHPLAIAATAARQLVQQSAFERLCAVDGLSKQRQHCHDICYILQQMAHLALLNGNASTAARWKRVLTCSYDCQRALERRVNTKLALTQLMVSL